MRLLIAALVVLSVLACTKKVEPTAPDGGLPATVVEEPPVIAPLPDFKPTEIAPDASVTDSETK